MDIDTDTEVKPELRDEISAKMAKPKAGLESD